MSVYDFNGNMLSSGASDGANNGYNYAKWNGKHLVTDGNSLVASTNWGEHLASFLGMTHTNCGNSGSMLTPTTDTVDTIKANVANNYPAKCDLVILQGDTNGTMDGSVSDQMDGASPKATWMARMNYLVRCIRAKYPNVVIVCIPDSVRYGYYMPNGNTGNSTQPYDFAGNIESLQKMREFAEYNRINFWNFDGSTPFNPNHDDNYYSRLGDPEDKHTTNDVVHPSVYSFARAKGYAMAHFVAGLIFNPSAPNDAISNWEQFI